MFEIPSRKEKVGKVLIDSDFIKRQKMDRLNDKELVLPPDPPAGAGGLPHRHRAHPGGPRQVGQRPEERPLSNYGGHIFLAAQKNQVTESPALEEIYEIGTIAKIEKSAEQNNGSYRIVIQGMKRAQILSYVSQRRILPGPAGGPGGASSTTAKTCWRLSENLIALFEEYINLKRVRLPGIMATAEAQSAHRRRRTSSSRSSTSL